MASVAAKGAGHVDTLCRLGVLGHRVPVS